MSRAFPDWPKPSSIKCHKWRYSQVTESYPGRPGFVVLRSSPLLVASGDAFVHSNLDGCLAAAQKAAQAVADSCT